MFSQRNDKQLNHLRRHEDILQYKKYEKLIYGVLI
jgi:hypothetical protein